MTNPNQWTSEWPTEPGMYWFYGWPFLQGEPTDEPEWVSVEVFFDGGGKSVWVGGGHFMFKSENRGLWTPAILPDAPLEQLKELA